MDTNKEIYGDTMDDCDMSTYAKMSIIKDINYLRGKIGVALLHTDSWIDRSLIYLCEEYESTSAHYIEAFKNKYV